MGVQDTKLASIADAIRTKENSSEILFYRGNKNPQYSTSDLSVPVDTTDFEIFADFVNGTLNINGTEHTVTLGTPYMEKQIYIFARDYGIAGRTGPESYINMKLRYMKVYSKSDVLLYDFVPCTNADGVAGLYDLVKNKFYSSSSSIAFTAGPVI